MALGTYDELLTAIVDFAPEISDADPLALFITLAEAEFFPMVKHYLGEKTVTLNTAANAVTIPADFNEARVIRVDGQIAKPVSAYGATLGLNEIGYFRAGNSIAFVPSQPASRVVELTYYAQPTALSDDAETNWLLTKFPKVYLWSALAEGYAWRGNDEAEAMARGKFAEAFAGMSRDHLKSTLSGNQFVLNDGGFSYGD